ncbi:MAG: glycogen debranching enzyme, partial [Lapillicoccus sp.]
TLRDLVSYNEKHNEANGEGNNDGESHNRSWNCGVEGPTDDPAVRALRLREQRNFLTTLLLSQGVPMIAHGDELGRTQDGNNNAYCQDNELSWVDWDLEEDQKELLGFAQRIVRLRADHPVFRRRRFFAGSADHGGESALGDVAWFTPSGEHMDEGSWRDGYARSLMVFLNGLAIPESDRRGETIRDDSFLVIFNAHTESIGFTVPEAAYGTEWFIEIDTAAEEPAAHAASGAPDPATIAMAAASSSAVTVIEPGTQVTIQARSMMVLRAAQESGA